MSMRRTIGISLIVMISTGAIAKTPGKGSLPHPGQLQGKAQFPSCGADAHARSRHANSDSTDSSGVGDSSLGPVHTIGKSEIGRAAWYNWVGSRTASRFSIGSRRRRPIIALPLASSRKVTNLDTGHAVVVKINDRGPIGVVHRSFAARRRRDRCRSQRHRGRQRRTPCRWASAEQRDCSKLRDARCARRSRGNPLQSTRPGSIRNSRGPRRRMRSSQPPRRMSRAPKPARSLTINLPGSIRDSRGSRRRMRPSQPPRRMSRATRGDPLQSTGLGRSRVRAPVKRGRWPGRAAE